MTIHELIRHHQGKRRLSARDFADLAGVHWNTVYRWLSGESLPPRTRARAIARALDLGLQEVLDAIQETRAQQDQNQQEAAK